jgi:WD40 repeat protein
VQILKGRRNRVSGLVFSHCGRWIAACGYSGGVHVWDTTNPAEKPRVALDENPWTHGLAFRPDGRLFFIQSSYSHATRWCLLDPATGELTDVPSPPTQNVVPAPDGRRVIGVGVDSFNTWTVPDSGPPVPEASGVDRGTNINTVACSVDGATLVTAEHRPVKTGTWRRPLMIAVRDAATGKLIRDIAELPTVVPSQLALSKDGTRVFVCGTASVSFWSLTDPKPKPRKAGNPTRRHLLWMTVHPYGPVLTVDNERAVRVWEVPALTCERTIEWKIGKLYAVAVSPDGSRVAVGSHTGRVLVWDWD